MAVFKCYPASWAEHSAMEPGDLVFVVAPSANPPDTQSRRHVVTNCLYYRWADSHGHGSTVANPGQLCTARTLWADVADPDRGAMVAEALACERLVEVGTSYPAYRIDHLSSSIRPLVYGTFTVSPWTQAARRSSRRWPRTMALAHTQRKTTRTPSKIA